MPNNVIIPGMTKDTNATQEAINKIMDAKRVKLNNMEKEKQEINDKKKVLNEIRDKSVSLQSKAKKLYGFEAPFDDKVAESSDEKAFTATVTRNAEIGEHTIEINNKARSHKIASRQLEKNYKVGAGNYNIQVGSNKVKISFSGGTLEQFADAINSQSKDILRATVTRDSVNTQILVIEAVKTGNNNRITFLDEKTKDVFRKMDFFKEISAYDKQFKIDKKNLTNLSTTRREPQFLSNGNLLVDTNERFKYTLQEKIPYKEKLIMEVGIKIDKIDPNKVPEAQTPTGPNFSKKGEITIFDIPVDGESAIVNLPTYKKPEKPPVIEDDHYLEIVTNKREIKLEELDTNKNAPLQFNMNEIIGRDEVIEAVIFKNNNTYKKLEADSLHFYDEASKAGIQYNQELSKPEDASLVWDGIKIQRDNNNIDDLVNGVTLNIFDKTNREENLKIDRNYPKIVESLTGFLGDFNQLVELVNKHTNANANEEGKSGEFAGDYGLLSLVNKLRTIMMNSHNTTYGDELALLAQIGISTNESGIYQMDKTKLKGILEVNEDKFINQMQKYSLGVKELFGKDSDGDLLPDTGIGVEVETLLKSYTAPGQGFFAIRSNTFDSSIKNIDKNISNYKEKLDEEEQKLKEQFYKMDKASKDLEENSKKLDNFNKQQ